MESPPTNEDPTRGGHDPQDLTAKIAQLEETVTRLDENQRHLQQTNKQLFAKFEEHRKRFLSLRNEHNCLQAKHTKLREGHAGLQDDHTSLETAHKQLRTDHLTLEQTLAELTLYLSTFQEEHQQVLDDHNLLKKEQEELATKVTYMNSEPPKPPSPAGNLPEEQNDAERQTPSTKAAGMTSQSHDLVSVEDRDVQRGFSADLHRLSSDVSRFGNDCRELHAEMAELRTLHGELVRNQNELQNVIMNRPETKQVELQHGDREERDTFQERMMNLQKEHIDTVLAEQWNMEQKQASERNVLWTHVEQMMTSLQESLNETNHALTVLETRLRGAKRLFYTRDLNTSRTTHGEAMIFNTVLVEEGGHYNHQTGVFKAPQPGLYFFIATIESRFQDTTAVCRIIADDDIQCVVKGAYFGGSGCVLVPLTTGQKVWLMAYNPSARPDCWSPNGSFSGTLVVPFQENPEGGS